MWIMRQAGRYLPEYRALRERIGFWDSCRTPEVACEITLQPVRRIGVDAAILFSDILVPLPGMGVPVEFAPGPRIDSPLRTQAAIEALRVPDPHEDMGFVMDAVRLVRRELAGSVPLIGFAGSPFTIATYLVEGGASKSFSAIKTLLVSDPPLAHRLLATCAETMAAYLCAQVQAGIQAAMLFDTWAGILSPEDYRTFAFPYARRVFEAVAAAAASDRLPEVGTAGSTPLQDRSSGPSIAGESPGVRASSGASTPLIYYAGDAAGHLEMVRDIGADVIGLDWRLGLGDARARLGTHLAFQGNLDPAVLLAARPVIEERAARVLRQAKGESSIAGPSPTRTPPASRPGTWPPRHPGGVSSGACSPDSGRLRPDPDGSLDSLPVGPATGHIFNLGHGILPETPPDHARFLVETIQRLSRIQ